METSDNTLAARLLQTKSNIDAFRARVAAACAACGRHESDIKIVAATK